MPTIFALGSSVLMVCVAALLAGVGVLAGVPLVERWARRGGWVDAPSGERWHEEATPHLGGIALVGAVAVALVLSGGWGAFPGAVWLGVGCLFAVGLADDLWTLGLRTKLAAQITATGLVLWSGLLFWPAGPLWGSMPLTALWVLGLTNAVNLLDAMDGVAAGVAAVAASIFLLIAALEGHLVLAAVAASVATAAAGFLAYNAAPARIFMGDSGSLPLGFLLAVMGLGLLQPPGSTPLAVPILVLAVPLFDTTFVSLTRLWRGQSVSEGGVDHVAHRLVRLGWTEQRAAQLLWGAAAGCGWIGVIGVWGASVLFQLLAVAAGISAIGLGVFLARRTRPHPPSPFADRADGSKNSLRDGPRKRS